MSIPSMQDASRQQLRETRAALDGLLLDQVDGRGRSVHIPARTLALSLAVYALEEDVTSLLQLDHKLRQPRVQEMIGCSSFQSCPQAPVVSDSTLRQALQGWPAERIRTVGSWLYRSLRDDGRLGLTLPSGRSLNVGVLDSSSFGDCYSNCITAVTDSNTYPLDLEAHEGFKRGKELGASCRLLKRWARRFELLLFDGLYLKSRVWEALQAPGQAELLVKYPVKEERERAYPWPLKQARFMVRKGLRETHTLRDERYEEAATAYRVRFRTRGHEVMVDRFVVETKGKEDFFTVTTRTDLTVADTWELSHQRWSIENQGFRALSLHQDSKGQHRRGGPRLPPPVKFTLLLWLLLFQSVFRFLAARHVSEDERKNVKVTEGWLFECVRAYWEALWNDGRGGEP